jgi:hypothetical protein
MNLGEVADDSLVEEFPDEVLERSAHVQGVTNYTMIWCTALDLCPGP